MKNIGLAAGIMFGLGAALMQSAIGAADSDDRALAPKLERIAVDEHRVALVVGNAKYAESPLRNPVNDAKAMAKTLRALGFQVIERTDTTQKELNRAITEFGSRLRSDSVALFYYAGHGMQVRGRNFLIPVDAEISSEASVKSESVDVDTVIEQIAGNASALNLVILDACRNNPFERRFRGAASAGLAQMDAPKGTLIAYATAPGKTANDGSGANGIYTQELLGLLAQPGLKVEEVFKRVRVAVAKATNDQQLPWESSSLTGDFFFRPQAPAPVVSAAQAVTAAPAANLKPSETDLWRGASQIDTSDAYQAYLDEYPDGNYAKLAKAALKKLSLSEKAALPPAPPVPLPAPVPHVDPGSSEADVWRAASNIDTKEAYQAYLEQYPNGRFGRMASAALKKFLSKREVPKEVVLATAKPVAISEPAPAAASVPRAGDIWAYEVFEGFTERVLGEFQIKVIEASDGKVVDAYQRFGSEVFGRQAWTRNSSAFAMPVVQIPLGNDTVAYVDVMPIVESMALARKNATASVNAKVGNTFCWGTLESKGTKSIKVPAGTFETEHLLFTCTVDAGVFTAAARAGQDKRLQIEVWMSSSLYRAVQVKKTYEASGVPGGAANDTFRLTRFQPGS